MAKVFFYEIITFLVKDFILLTSRIKQKLAIVVYQRTELIPLKIRALTSLAVAPRNQSPVSIEVPSKLYLNFKEHRYAYTSTFDPKIRIFVVNSYI